MITPDLIPAAVVSAAIAPALLFLWLVVAADSRVEPPRVVAIAVGLGVVSALLAVGAEFLLQHFVPLAANHWLAADQNAFLFAALPEEAIKVSIIAAIALRSHNFEEPMDGVVYGTAVGLGFAGLENLFYLIAEADWHSVAIMRGLLSVPFHGALGAIAGAYIARARFGGALGSHRGVHGRRQRLFLMAYLVPVVLHTLFDAPLFTLEKLPAGYSDTDDGALTVLLILLIVPVVGFGAMIHAAILARRIARRQKEALHTKRLPPTHWRDVWAECLVAVGLSFVALALAIAGRSGAQIVGWALLAIAVGVCRKCGKYLSEAARKRHRAQVAASSG